MCDDLDVERNHHPLNLIFNQAKTLSPKVHDIITSGKNFIKITSVGMGAAKSNETR